MFARKLQALHYENAQKFNAQDDIQFKNLILWLEDQKIRYYTIEDRASLRNLDSNQWNVAFKQYLEQLGCPFDSNNSDQKNLLIDWLLGHAVRLEYADQVDSMKEISGEKIKSLSSAPQIRKANPLDNLDFNSEDFKSGVRELAKALQVPQHPDHLVVLRGISLVLQRQLEIEKEKRQSRVRLTNKSKVSIEDEVLGFDTGDKVLDGACKVMRLLYINDLRDLQTKINEIIARIQSVTANPKTDTSLGKVGK